MNFLTTFEADGNAFSCCFRSPPDGISFALCSAVESMTLGSSDDFDVSSRSPFVTVACSDCSAFTLEMSSQGSEVIGVVQ